MLPAATGSSDEQQLYIAVIQWIAASLAGLPRFELCVHNSTQLSQVSVSLCVCPFVSLSATVVLVLCCVIHSSCTRCCDGSIIIIIMRTFV